MVFSHDDSSLSPGPQSPLRHSEVDDTVNYSQFQREASLPTGDLFFLSIMSPLSWTDDTGEQSFIHNPKEGPYTPVHSSTPFHDTGDDMPSGHRVSSGRSSPYSRRSRSPPSSQRTSKNRQSPSRAHSPARTPNQSLPNHSPSPATPPSLKTTLEHVLLSLEMAEANQAHWDAQTRNCKLSFQEQCQAQVNFTLSNRMVRQYTAVFHQLEAAEIVQQTLRSPPSE